MTKPSQLLLRDEFRLDSNSADPIRQESRQLLLRRLQRLSCDACLLPHQLSVRGVVKTDKYAAISGGYADVFSGDYNGQNVAIKHLRVFSAPSHMRTITRVCGMFTAWISVLKLVRFEGVLSRGSSVVQSRS